MLPKRLIYQSDLASVPENRTTRREAVVFLIILLVKITERLRERLINQVYWGLVFTNNHVHCGLVFTNNQIRSGLVFTNNPSK